MGKLLYLVHRLPYPPNKGDKVRSYHLLKHLAQHHQVFLGTVIDDPADEAYVETVRGYCADLHIARVNPTLGKLKSLAGLLTGEALSLRFYRDAGLRDWVARVAREHRLDGVVVFSSAMGQFVPEGTGATLLVDFVDVDSAKWAQYAPNHRWPLSWLYRREGERLLAYERALAARARRSFFVTDNEVALFTRLAPETAGAVDAVSNGVDADFFSPAPDRASPFPDPADHQALVFTGAMDYWPNIDAVTWFVQDILPRLRRDWPQLCFYVVGRSPPPAVQALAGPGVVVTGTVPDVRPYLQHAAVVVAPLRVARGIQNKILEAMAMARPVVAAQSCVEAIDAVAGEELLAADSVDDYVARVDALLRDPQRCAAIGTAGRQRVLASYSWAAHLARMDIYLNAADSQPPHAA